MPGPVGRILGDDNVRHYCRWRGAWLSGQGSPAIAVLRHYGMARALVQAAALRPRPDPAPIPAPDGDQVAEIVTVAAAGMIAGVLTMETG